MGALDDRFGPGTEAELAALYTPGGFDGWIESEAKEDHTLYRMRWEKKGERVGFLQIRWYYDDSLIFEFMYLEEKFRGQGLYKHTCRPVVPAWYKAHGLKYGTATGADPNNSFLQEAGNFKAAPPGKLGEIARWDL
jgi:hypothetical protein